MIVTGNIYSGLNNMGIVANNGLSGLGTAASPVQLGGALLQSTLINGAFPLNILLAAGGNQVQLYLDPAARVTQWFYTDVSGSSCLLTLNATSLSMAFTDPVTGTNQIKLGSGLVQSQIADVYNTQTVNSATANNYVEIGQVQASALDTNGVELSEMIIKVILSADARSGGSPASSTAALEFDIRATFWQANGTWQVFSPTVRQGLNSNSAYQVVLQGFYSNVGTNAGFLKLRLINKTGMLSFGWNVSIYVLRPKNSRFTALNGTGTDAATYTVYNSSICQDYINNNIVILKPFSKFLTGGIIFNLPTTNGNNLDVLVSDGSGNTSWSSNGGNTASIVAKNKVAGASSSQTLATSVVGSTSAQYRINSSYIQRAGVGTAQVTITYTSTDGVVQTISLSTLAAAGQVTSNSAVDFAAAPTTTITISLVITGAAIADVFTVLELLF